MAIDPNALARYEEESRFRWLVDAMRKTYEREILTDADTDLARGMARELSKPPQER